MNIAPDSAPVVQWVQHILAEAVSRRASDIHLEPFEDGFQVRYRIDGTLFQTGYYPKHIAAAAIARIKILADLNISEQRLPQDGSIQTVIDGRSVDLRVATLPTYDGETLVLRVLDSSVSSRPLQALGMPEDMVQKVQKILTRPYGMFAVTGPTGSGKTTTLYSTVAELNQTPVKILTIEDPIEYALDGILQTAIDSAARLDFPRALRSFLRHDPDVIMVGEIRDAETAHIAVQAALTGHRLLTTLHTGDAVGAVTRLIDLGVAPYLAANALEGVIAQRLLRRLCPSCREISSLGETHPLYPRVHGCEDCSGTGYKGRLALFELLLLTEQMREAIIDQRPLPELRRLAVSEGMVPLAEYAQQALNKGLTSMEEVKRWIPQGLDSL